MRKISHEEINPRFLSPKPMVSTDNFGSPSFYTPDASSPNLSRRAVPAKGPPRASMTRRISHYHTPSMQYKVNSSDDSQDSFVVIDERDMIMELVRDIAMDLDVTSVSHRILQASDNSFKPQTN